MNRVHNELSPGVCRFPRSLPLFHLVLLFCGDLTSAADPASDLAREAQAALKRAAVFYRERVASHGGYVYYYSEDLKQRWGEGRAAADTIFVQPPGTPTVGMAYLQAFAATGDRYYLESAREAARALVDGQLQSGGWTQVIHFAPAERMGKYRTRKGGDWNATSLDDGQTQAALTMLIRFDRAVDSKDETIHEAAQFGLESLLKAQFANGAFPQVWTGPVAARPIVKAAPPDYEWRTEGRIKNYWDQYTLNDNLAGTVSGVLIEAHHSYRDEKFLSALKKLGDFLLLAQLPEPQPAWCQQYNEQMNPIWARKFEPPAVSGWESQDVLETLIKIARYTGDKKYLEPLPRAIGYLRSCVLADGRIARFYELGTNRPLYMDDDYQLTYDDSKAPSHYGWKQPVRLDAIERAWKQAAHESDDAPILPPEKLPTKVREIIGSLDSQGRWISTYNGEPLVGQPKFPRSFRYVSSALFAENVETLCRFLEFGVNRP
jgi:hypothetical protein